jgi:hypothetical protein
MAYAFKVHRVTISGTCFGGQEIWSTGFFLGSPTADAGTASQAQVDAIATRWGTFFTLAANKFSNAYLTQQVKVALLNTDGTTDPANVVYHTYPTALAGGSAASALPPQISLAASMTSALPRGMASKGRMYLPGYNAVVDATAHISSTDMGTIATAFQTFINGVNTDGTSSAKVILASFGRLLPTVIAGSSQLVTGVRIGNVFDTQRRRRDGLIEAYTARTIP